MPTIFKRGKQFYINYSVNGKRIRKAVGEDEKEAKILYDELRYKLNNGDLNSKRPEIPINFFFNKYLENCKTRLSEGTQNRYRCAIDHLYVFRTFRTFSFKK